MQNTKNEPSTPFWKRQAHPSVMIFAIIGLILMIGYAAYMFELLPVKPMSEFGNRLGQLARDSGGDFDKLKPADQKYLNDHTGGRGKMAIGAYYKSR